MYNNTQLPFPIQTVSSITNNDGNGNVSTTNYTYSGGYFHIGERDFRGFNYAKETGQTGPNGEQSVTETWFHQGNETTVIPESVSTDDLKTYADVQTGYMKGKPYRTRNKYSESMITYTPDTNGAPYFTAPNQVDSYTYDGDSNYTQTKTLYTYDGFGNVVREDQYGDINDSTDDRTIVRAFLPNTSNWIVGLPASEDIYQGIGTANKIAGKVYYYDDLTACNGSPTNNQTPVYGKLTRVALWLNGGTNPEARMAYNSFGNLICQRDAKGNTSSITYDTSNTFPTLITNPLGQQTVNQYYGVNGVPADKGLYGQVKNVTDPNNATTATEYDVFGRKTKETLPDGTWTSMTYNNFGTVGTQNVRKDNSAGLWKATYFDGLGRTIKEKSSGPDQKTIVSVTTYNVTGTVKQTSLPYFDGLDTPRYQTYIYDSLGRATKVSNPDSTFNLACYNDGVTVKIDANGHRRREVRDALGRTVKVQEYTGSYSSCTTDEGTPYATTLYSYDILGNLRFVTDAKANKTEMRYDTLGRKYYMKDPDMGVWSYIYDANGNLTAQTDAKGNKIVFGYDALNRLITKHYPAGTDVTLTYDLTTSSNSKGRLSKMTDGSGQTIYNYDKVGRIINSARTIYGVSYPQLSLGYLNGRLDSITYPDNEKVNYGYDSGGNLTSAGSFAAYSGFNALGQPGKVTYGNGIATTYQYDTGNNRLKGISTTRGPTPLLSLLYSYDKVGNISGIGNVLNNTRSQSFTYDELNRLNKSVNSAYGTLNYSYDQIGNILTKEGVSYIYGTRPHAVASLSTGKVYSYDANGNIQSDGQRNIAYDYDNMPTSIGTVSFTYDGNGTRVKKTSPNGTTVYVDKLYECTNGVCAKYIFAENSRIARINNGLVLYYHPDHLGSTSIVTDATGAIAEDINYAPFGGTRQDTGVVNLSHKYTDQEKDSETGLYNYNARLYDPDLGRFMSPDSIVQDHTDPQALNRYSYARNNPMLYSDPTGHFFGIDDALVVAFIADVIVGAAEGAAVGATVSAATGGDIGMGAMTGAISGGFFGGAGFGINTYGVDNSFAQAGIHAAAGASSEAINSTITGGDVGMGAAIGGLSAGVAKYAGGFLPDNYATQLVGRSVIGGVIGGSVAEAYGGDFGKGFANGAMTSGIGYLANGLSHRLGLGNAIKEAVVKGFGGARSATSQAYVALKDIARDGPPEAKATMALAATPMVAAAAYVSGPYALSYALMNPQGALEFISTQFPGPATPITTKSGLWGVGFNTIFPVMK